MHLLALVFCLLFLSLAQALEFDADEMLEAHNRWRDTAHVPSLIYSTKLSVSAQNWANNLKQNNHCQMKHSQPNGQYGENLFWASALEWSNGKRELQQVNPNTVVNSWGNERADYNYKNNSCREGKMCGHFTQLVWQSTTSVGCAVAECEDSHEQIWVCQYQPAGNWIGQKPY